MGRSANVRVLGVSLSHVRITQLQLLVLAILGVWTLGIAVGFLWSLRILVVGAALAAIQLPRRPAVALIGVTALCALDPLIRVYLSGDLLRWNTFNFWLVLVALVSIPFQLRAPTAQSALLAALTFLLLVGLLYTPDLSGGIQDIIQSVAAFFALRYYVARALDAAGDCVYRAGVVTAWLVAGGGLVFELGQASLPEINSNTLGIFLVTGPVAAALAVGIPRRRRGRRDARMVWIPATICFAWVVLSGSRSATAVGAICLLYLFFVAAQRRATRAVVATAVIGVLVAGILSLFPVQRDAAFDKVSELLTSDQSLADRTDLRSSLALGAVKLARDNPFGVGTGGFRQELVDSPHTAGVPYEPHSGWAKILGENGFGALILALAFVVSYPVAATRRRASGLLPLSVMAAAVMGVAGLANELQAKWFWLVAAALAEVLHRVPVEPSVAPTEVQAPLPR